MSTLKVGFVGIGNMGWPMARNIVAAGHDVTVLDADRARARRFAAEHGAHAAETPEALGRDADIVVTMLPAGRDVREVVLGPFGADLPLPGDESPRKSVSKGIASGLHPGAVVVDMSSSDPLGTRALGAALAERGIALIDAPVSGLVAKAETGTLTIMIGTDDESALERVRPVLAVLGERLVRVGSLGCGHAMKALNNVTAAAAFAATAEALIIGKRFGLDPGVMLDVLNTSTGRNFHTDMSFPAHVLPRRFATGFTLGLLAKDVAIAADLGTSLDAKAPLIDLVSRLFAEGRDEIGADADNTAVVKRWERLNNIVVSPGGESE